VIWESFPAKLLCHSARKRAVPSTFACLCCVLTATGITDDYLKKHPTAPEVQHLTSSRNNSWESLLLDGVWMTPDFPRIHGDFAEDEAKHTTTVAMNKWNIKADDLKRLGKDAFMLQGFVDQPTLKKLPLYSQFVDSVGSLHVPDGNAEKAAQAWSKKAEKTWTTLKLLPCGEHPTAHALLFDLGLYSSTYAPE
jgi:hypothetical protein